MSRCILLKIHEMRLDGRRLPSTTRLVFLQADIGPRILVCPHHTRTAANCPDTEESSESLSTREPACTHQQRHPDHHVGLHDLVSRAEVLEFVQQILRNRDRKP